MLHLLSAGAASGNMDATAIFLIKVRQIRRRLQLKFERHQEQILKHGFIYKRAAWRLRGRPLCRHGVLFTRLPPNGCKCMHQHSLHEDWEHAAYMPVLDYEIKMIVARPFCFDAYERLGILQSKARQFGW